MRLSPRLLLIGTLGISTFACSSTPPQLPPPDPVTWQPANVSGPALFIAKAVRSEAFEDLKDADYACHTAHGQGETAGSQLSDAKRLGKICISNSCGLARYTLVPETIYQGDVPQLVILNSEMGEWCESTYVDGQRFLIAVPAQGHWSASELMDTGADPSVLADNSGCLGDLDLKPLLAREGKELGPFHSKDYLEWRTQWQESDLKACQIRLTKDLEYKVLPLSRVVAVWKEQHPLTGNNP